jgi:hypothetical protein
MHALMHYRTLLAKKVRTAATLSETIVCGPDKHYYHSSHLIFVLVLEKMGTPEGFLQSTALSTMGLREE